MKKIISLLSVIAMLFTMLTTVAFAEGEEGRFYWEQTAKDDTSVTLALVFDVSRECSKIQASYKLNDAFAGGVTVTEVSRHAKATVFQLADATAAATKQVISITIADTDIATKGKVVMGEFKFDFANATINSFTLPQAKNASVNGQTSTDKVTFVNEAAGYTVNAPVVEPQITINNKYVFNFTADAGQEVMVKLTRANGIESDLTYSLPELVKGEASIFGLLKVTDNTVVSGDKFDISVVDANRNPVKEITTIIVD